jgi:CoA:oxalate CoA-transferase
MPGPLSGTRVVDLTRALAGPYCTLLLGDMGADVVKIELPETGDETRQWGPPFIAGESSYFMSVNRNKRSITLNLKRASARAALLRMAERADVFVENNRPGVMRRLGLDYQIISSINPRIVYASISGFGQTGPYSQRPAFDAVTQAMSGMMSLTGDENGPPARVGMSIGDIGGSLFATIGILAALADRTITGRGSQVDVAMFDSQVALLENAVARYLNAGDRPTRLGSRHPLIAPFQAFPTRDEPIVICVDTEEQWRRFCDAIGRSDLIKNPSFKDGNARAEHHAQLEPQLISALSKRTRLEWLSIFDAAQVPAGPINDVPTMVKDPQVIARGMVDRLGNGAFVKQPIKFSTYSDMPEQPPPILGEHTQTVLSECGYSIDEILAMQAEGAT